MSSSFLIYANYYTNWSTAVLAIINLLWAIQICVTGFIQRKQLNEWVGDMKNGQIVPKWKAPVIISTLLVAVSLGLMFVPTLGIPGYVISLVATCLQVFFMIDFRKYLKKHISESWFSNSTVVSAIIGILAAISIFCFIITTIAVTNFI